MVNNNELGKKRSLLRLESNLNDREINKCYQVMRSASKDDRVPRSLLLSLKHVNFKKKILLY